jgi:hypothetical protein
MTYMIERVKLTAALRVLVTASHLQLPLQYKNAPAPYIPVEQGKTPISAGRLAFGLRGPTCRDQLKQETFFHS